MWLQKSSRFLEGAEGSVWTSNINKQARGEVLLACSLVAKEDDLIYVAEVNADMTMRWENFKT